MLYVFLWPWRFSFLKTLRSAFIFARHAFVWLFPISKKKINLRPIVLQFRWKSPKELKAIPKIKFEKCFDDWKMRWHKFILLNGFYLKGDIVYVYKWINMNLFQKTKIPIVSLTYNGNNLLSCLGLYFEMAVRI